MTNLKLFGAVAILSVLIASAASAQPAVQEPGMAAFYNPNADLGIGSTRPASDAQARISRLI
ncbi:MAG: hypothetical protein ACJ8EE_19585, partial [Bradyrhizobium sp.]